jgi:hypothetical protein
VGVNKGRIVQKAIMFWIGGWVGVLLSWNPYFPWYPTISTMTIPIITTYISKKLLNYLEYTEKANLNAHVLVF